MVGQFFPQFDIKVFKLHTTSHVNIFTQKTLITFQKQANHNHLPSIQTERQIDTNNQYFQALYD